jgi:hypothetical protein
MSDAVNGLLVGISNVVVQGSNFTLVNNPCIISKVTSSNAYIPDLGSSLGYVKAISFFTPTSIRSDGTFGLPLVYGVTQSYTEGSPSAPCLELSQPSMWRFKWTVGGGNRTISIKSKQATNSISASRPSMVIKANTSIGLNNDVSGSAPSSTGWVTIGPLSFTSNASGSVIVELYNNSTTAEQSSAYFDHIVVN